MIQSINFIGSASDVTDFARRYIEAGVEYPILMPMPWALITLLPNSLREAGAFAEPLVVGLTCCREPSCVPGILKKLHAGSLSDEVYRFRFGRQWSPISISDVLEGGGFEISNRGSGNGYLATKVVPTLPDSVAAEMLVLFVGLNPSPSPVEHGYAFAGKSNRFWPAVYEAGIVSKVVTQFGILETDHVGMISPRVLRHRLRR